MQKFILTLTLFLLPVFLVLAPPLIVFVWSGESYSIRSVGETARQSHPVLFGPAYTDVLTALKLQEALERRPPILALGSSRVQQFPSLFFKDKHSFYNGGGAVRSINQFRYFIDALGTTTPNIVIASMDQYYFNPETLQSVTDAPNPFSATTSVGVLTTTVQGLFGNGGWWKLYQEYGKHTFTLSQLSRRHDSYTPIGLGAQSAFSGMMNDGSSYDGAFLESPARQAQTLAQIHTMAGGVQYHSDEYGSAILPSALEALRAFLSDCKQKRIHVIGFLPPVAHAVYEQMKLHPDASYAASLQELPHTLAALYREYGFDFYDFSNTASFGSSDAEMVEGKHGSQKMYLRMFIRMVRDSVELQPFVDLPYLERSLADATSPYEVFDPLAAVYPNF